jgi:hypothetical protein
MIGVFSFYATLLESTFEKKLITYSYNLIPRFYNEFNFLKLKRVEELLRIKNKISFPKKKIRIYTVRSLS